MTNNFNIYLSLLDSKGNLNNYAVISNGDLLGNIAQSLWYLTVIMPKKRLYRPVTICQSAY